MQTLTIRRGIAISLFSCTLLFTACETQKASTTTTEETTTMTSDRHVSQNALDYDGIYRGTLPCADCEGIKTTVYLMKDNTYKTEMEYLGKENSKFESKGSYSWNNDGTTITLQDKDGNTQFAVGENTLTQLDADGKQVTSALAPLYILTKDNYGILNRKWRLVEIMGKPVTDAQTNNQGAFLQFLDSENRYTAITGCNNISGTFSTESFNKLKLGMGMSTMKACADMSIENKMKEVLQTADSFQLNPNELILIKGRMAPLARFVAPVN